MYVVLLVLFFILWLLSNDVLMCTSGAALKECTSGAALGECNYDIVLLLSMPVLLLVFNIIFSFFRIKNTQFFWALSHFLSYFGLTFLCPSRWALWAFIGTLWEFYECELNTLSFITCNGISDIIINIVGIIFGLVLNLIFKV